MAHGSGLELRFAAIASGPGQRLLAWKAESRAFLFRPPRIRVFDALPSCAFMTENHIDQRQLGSGRQCLQGYGLAVSSHIYGLYLSLKTRESQGAS
jgi:hypothetical protein